MPSKFTRILNGELPGRLVYEDDLCVALLSGTPIRPGHTLVVPREEIEHWVDLPPALMTHLMQVAQRVGAAIQRCFPCKKIGLISAGIVVPHVHLHLTPIDDLSDMDLARQDKNASDADLDAAAAMLKAALAGK